MEQPAKIVYRLGDMVRIKEGPFAAFTGRIKGINQSKALLNVQVNIYGRRTPVKLSFHAVEKLEFEPNQPQMNTDLNGSE